MGRSKIIEEVADVILCALSAAHHIDATDEEIASMVWAKATKWSGLLEAERGVAFPLPFEIHVTVRPVGIEPFRDLCGMIGVKPIVIDLQTRAGSSLMLDVQTSSKMIGTNSEAFEECDRIARELDRLGAKVVRKKIETVPWHPKAPRGCDPMLHGCYFECHFAVTMEDETARHAQLGAMAELLGCHRSRNIFKKLPDGTVVVLMTLRAYDGNYDDFATRVKHITDAMEQNGFTLGKVETEFSIYDTKVTHDEAWTNAGIRAPVAA